MNSGKTVNDRITMQTTAVYACLRILLETTTSLHMYTEIGKEKARNHPIYRLLSDSPNP